MMRKNGIDKMIPTKKAPRNISILEIFQCKKLLYKKATSIKIFFSKDKKF